MTRRQLSGRLTRISDGPPEERNRINRPLRSCLDRTITLSERSSVSQAASRCLDMADTGIDPHIENVGEKVDDNPEQGEEEHDSLDEEEVPIVDGLNH